MKDYSKGKIYVIRNNIDGRIYIGSTCKTLTIRMGQHRAQSKRECLNTKMYKTMRELTPSCFYIELLEDFKCENGDQLRRREGELIRQYQPELNKNIAGRTHEEFYIENKEVLIERSKDYYHANKGYVEQMRKTYYETNIDNIKEYRRLYYQKYQQQKL